MPAKRQRLAARRKAAGFSQERLAERLGIDRSTVARWESGETEPQPWIRPRLARVLQVSLHQLDRLLVGGGQTEAGAAERMSYALTHPGSANLVTVAGLRSQVHHLDEQRAQGLLEQAAAAHRDHSKPRAIVLGNLALALIRQGDLDEAAGRLHEAIDIIELNRGGGGLNIAFTAAREMRPWRTVPAVQDACDRLLTLMAG